MPASKPPLDLLAKRIVTIGTDIVLITFTVSMKRISLSNRSLISSALMALLLSSAAGAQPHTADSATKLSVRSVSGKLVQPKMLNNIKDFVEYPAAAAKEGKEGLVILTTLIGPGGEMEKLKLVRTTDSIFVAPSMAAIKKVKFAPATQDGTAITSWVQIPIHFKLHKKKE
jgi:TonB family protein